MQAFSQDPRYQAVALDHAAIDVTDKDSVRKALMEVMPAVVINCAAFNRVDECEARPEKAFRVNALGALHVAKACTAVGALGVYFSSDFVFDGSKGRPCYEDDVVCPINVYGVSKASGELLVRGNLKDHLIIRSSSLFGLHGHSGKANFVETIMKKAKAHQPLQVVENIRMSPTYARDLALRVKEFVEGDVRETVHVTNDGECSWWEFACEIVRRAGVTAVVERQQAKDVHAAALRPAYSALRSRRHEPMRHWGEALAEYLDQRKQDPRVTQSVSS